MFKSTAIVCTMIGDIEVRGVAMGRVGGWTEQPECEL